MPKAPTENKTFINYKSPKKLKSKTVKTPTPDRFLIVKKATCQPTIFKPSKTAKMQCKH